MDRPALQKAFRRQRSSDEFRMSLEEISQQLAAFHTTTGDNRGKEAGLRHSLGGSGGGHTTRLELGVGDDGNKPSIKSGRQRKKQAVRTKGGEFAQRRKKRRVYSCSVSSDLDVEKMDEEMSLGPNDGTGWRHTRYTNVLHLYLHHPGDSNEQSGEGGGGDFEPGDLNADLEEASAVEMTHAAAASMASPRKPPQVYQGSPDLIVPAPSSPQQPKLPLTSHLWNAGSKEVFVFDFGAIVFWGFSLGEENGVLNFIRSFTLAEDKFTAEEFEKSEDDMAFVTSPSSPDGNDAVSIANDVFSLPEETTVKQRLAISFAIAQSSVLAIFEARIEKKVADFRYIPETFARDGKISLPSKKLGKMIGDVFVIRHDVNLHTEILDTPDWFWEHGGEDLQFSLYKLTYDYLEMDGRTSIINKRLDMLRELLTMLLQQSEAEHNVKLEMIIIWLIICSVFLEAASVGGKVLGWWD